MLTSKAQWDGDFLRFFQHGGTTIFVQQLDTLLRQPNWYTGHHCRDERGEFMRPVYVGADEAEAIRAWEQEGKAYIFICRLTEEELKKALREVPGAD